ncbi:MAG: ACT domain-containing protein [Lachnospiraceae bacterium]|nr:ACT domain-containing protein [Lachnospiraceae bacterium]
MSATEEEQYFLVKKSALPEVYHKVVEAKRLLDSQRNVTIQEATDAVGISRSSFYKYKDDIFPFHDNARGKTVTFMMQVDDEPGLLSKILSLVAKYQANILTIHQSIPVNRIAMLTISVEIATETGEVTQMIQEIEALSGMHFLKIIARE